MMCDTGHDVNIVREYWQRLPEEDAERAVRLCADHRRSRIALGYILTPTRRLLPGRPEEMRR